MSMSGVNENPTCVYSATLTLPQACGIDMTVGNEAASVSGTAVPATPSSSKTVTFSGTETQSGSYTGTSSYTGTITGTQTQSGSYTSTASYTGTISSNQTQTMSITYTSTPLFEMVAYPSKSVTPSIPVTRTPLFMVTAWTTVSPVNVSAVVTSDSSSPTSSTGVILGAVAVGLVGLLVIGFAINHFRKGGTVAGFMKEVESKKEELKKVASMLPLSDEQKEKLDKALDNPSSLLPVEAQKMLESVKEVKNKVVAALPVSEEQKAQINSVIESLPAKLVEKVSAPKAEPKVEPKPEPEVKKEEPPLSREVSIVIDPAHIEAVKEFLASKNADVKTD